MPDADIEMYRDALAGAYAAFVDIVETVLVAAGGELEEHDGERSGWLALVRWAGGHEVEVVVFDALAEEPVSVYLGEDAVSAGIEVFADVRARHESARQDVAGHRG